MKNLIFRTIFVTAICLSLLAACAPSETVLDGADRDAALAYSEAKTDNLLAGLEAGDYATFSLDFDQEMLDALPESQFQALKQDREAKLGKYISREVTSVRQKDAFVIVIYTAKFEKEDKVTMRVVFRAAEPHQVSGLWFDK